MQTRTLATLLAATTLVVASAAWAGCGRGSGPAPLALDQVPARLEGVFDHAPPETRALSTEAAQAVRRHAAPAAFVPLQALSEQPGLTAEQRAVVTRSLLAVHSELRQQAAGGDHDAAALLQAYRASK